VTSRDEYARFAFLYDGLIGPFLRPVHESVVRELRAHGCAKVVDLCCGTGLAASMAVGAGMRVVGVDSSAAMLARARSAHPEVGFISGDAADTGLAARSFSGCLISFALHEKPPEVGLAILAEARRLVVRDGVIVVADYRTPQGTSPGSRLAGGAIALVERLAGQGHHACFREFLRVGGSGAFLRRAGLDAAVAARFMAGWVGVYRARVR
jgi:demethylmenaquinone methyltransferase/2-methoxy-6-polyprenyl-1,4-benzoquinol methylase